MEKRCVIWVVGFFLVGIMLPGSAQASTGQVPAGITASEWSQIRDKVVERSYLAHEVRAGVYGSVNPVHDWEVVWHPDGETVLSPRSGVDYHIRVRLDSVGYGAETGWRPRYPPRVEVDGVTVFYHWGEGVREWWVNSPSGVEQWFELRSRPASQRASRALYVTLRLKTDLNVAEQPGGSALRF